MNKYWIWFSRTNKIGAKAQNELLKKYKKPEIIWNLGEEELIKNFTKEQVKEILNIEYRKNIPAYIEYMEKNNIKAITIDDEMYPNKLRNIYDSPVVLYVKGNEKILDNRSIAIIGSRSCSKYGQQIAKQFAYNLAKNNINIIAGLAKGIDTFAHIGAIKAKKPTIAVLGNGVDIVYPKENEEVYKQIVKSNGTIISEYVIGTKPEKLNFPARNRIISALSDGVLVVEAAR